MQSGIFYICRVCLIEEQFTEKDLAEHRRINYRDPICSSCISEAIELEMVRKDEYLRDITIEQLQRFRDYIKDNEKFRKTYRDFIVERIDTLIQEKSQGS